MPGYVINQSLSFEDGDGESGRVSACEPSQCEWISRRRGARACPSDSLITAQVLYSTKYREMAHRAMLQDQTKVT